MSTPRHLLSCALLAGAALAPKAAALEKPEFTYRIFQFPADRIPRVDGDASDWSIVPESYAIGTDQLTNTLPAAPAAKPATVEVSVRVGWVKGLNRLFFLYEASDDYWDFSRPDLHNDIFEVVVDGDASGGPLIDKGHPESWTPAQVGESAARPDDRISVPAANWAIHGVHAQNYHIFTPSRDKDWCVAWGSPTWVKQLPWANAAQDYAFKPGEGGRYTLEFWITPFDYAGPEGPGRAVESMLLEDKIIGLAWAVLDFDDVQGRERDGFWNLSPRRTMYGHASELCAFRLMPLEPALRPALEARWSWRVIDHDRRLVAFTDESIGEVATWRWSFGDDGTSSEQHPQHAYSRPGNYVVILNVTGPDGTSRRAKVWDVQLR